jgi:hypothetical protein
MVNGFIILKKDYNGPREVLMPLQISLEPTQLRKPAVSFEDTFTVTHFYIPDSVGIEGDHLVIGKNTVGDAWWGPYITVPPGKYRVEVDYKINDNVSGPFLDLTACYRSSPQNVTVFAKKTVLGSEIATGQKGVAVMDFELKNWTTSLEIVGTNYGKADVSVYSVKFEEID